MDKSDKSIEIVFSDVANVNQSGSTLYDSNEPELSSSNYISSITTLLNNTIGITILLMPKLFYISGIIFGTIQLLIISLVHFISAYMLCWAGNIFGLKSYFEIGEKIFKGKKKYIVHFFYLSMLIGTILCYQTFVLKSLGETARHLFFPQLEQHSFHYTALNLFICVVTNIMILPFLFITQLKRLKILMKMCTCAIFASVFMIIIIYLFPDIISLKIIPAVEKDISYFRFEGIYTSLGVYMLSYCYHLIVVDVNYEVRPKNSRTSKIVILSNSLLAFTLYFIVSLLGYLTVYEEKKKLRSLDNFLVFLIVAKNNNSFLLHLTSILITISVLFGNIMNYVPLIRFINSKLNFVDTTLSSKILKDLNLESSQNEYELTNEEYEANYMRVYRFIVICIFLVILLLVSSIIIFNIRLDVVFNLVSAICTAPVCIILPSIFYLFLLRRDYFKNTGGLDYLSVYFVMIVGFLIWIYSLYGLFKI